MNKAIAGYRMLMILSAVDDKFSGKEDKIIKEYMIENFDSGFNFDSELEAIIRMPSEDYAIYFNDAMNAFYMDSTPEERNHFLDFAVKLVAADKDVTPRENLFLNELFNAWEENFTS